MVYFALHRAAVFVLGETVYLQELYRYKLHHGTSVQFTTRGCYVTDAVKGVTLLAYRFYVFPAQYSDVIRLDIDVEHVIEQDIIHPILHRVHAQIFLARVYVECIRLCFTRTFDTSKLGDVVHRLI